MQRPGTEEYNQTEANERIMRVLRTKEELLNKFVNIEMLYITQGIENRTGGYHSISRR